MSSSGIAQVFNVFSARLTALMSACTLRLALSRKTSGTAAEWASARLSTSSSSRNCERASNRSFFLLPTSTLESTASRSPFFTGSPACNSRRRGGMFPGELCGSSILPISTTSAGAKRTRTRIKRAGSRAVEPGITRGRVRVGCSATAICSTLPWRMPSDFRTSSGTRRLLGCLPPV